MRRASESKLRDEIAESLRGLFDVKVSKISAEDLSKTHPEIEKRILSALASRGVRCDGSSAALTLKSEKQIIEEASGVCGWGAFSEALARIARRMDNDASGRLNLNAASSPTRRTALETTSASSMIFILRAEPSPPRIYTEEI